MSKLNKHILNCLLFTFFILLSVTGFSQNNQETQKHLDSLTLKMFNDMNQRDYDAILEMTHPKVFEMVSKESLKNVFKSMFEGTEEFTIDVPKTIPDYKISEVFINENDSLQYAFVSYDMKMNMTFHNQNFDDAAKEMMIPMMKSKGIDVTFISENSMSMFMNNRMTIMLKDNHTNHKWVMVNYDADSPLFYQIVPTSLLESAKEYNQNLMLESAKEKEE
ncbi:hypothetical protein [Algibacter sp. R77976]|uniref:hypothetical protein n=1 Tax=Algibacter sp. R77976 TaxID=3093873 RepID=UPI0037C8BA61